MLISNGPQGGRTGEVGRLLAAALAGGAHEERRRLADQGAALPQAAGGVPERLELRRGGAVPARVRRPSDIAVWDPPMTVRSSETLLKVLVGHGRETPARHSAAEAVEDEATS